MKAMAKYLNHDITGYFTRYGTASGAEQTEPFLIDNYDAAINWYCVHETRMAKANLYYQDAEIAATIERTFSNATKTEIGIWPTAGSEVPTATSEASGYNGDHGIESGVMFKYAEFDGILYPFNISPLYKRKIGNRRGGLPFGTTKY